MHKKKMYLFFILLHVQLEEEFWLFFTAATLDNISLLYLHKVLPQPDNCFTYNTFFHFKWH